MSSQRTAALGFVLGALAALSCAHPGVTPMSSEPTVVYVAARIRTMDHEAPQARAMAVQDGKILAIGSEDAVTQAAGRGARRVDLGDATVVPGLVDAHAHLQSLGRSLSIARLNGARSSAEVVGRLHAAGPGSREGDWLVGHGWDQNLWDDEQRQFPSRRTLDEAFADTPVFLTRVDGHAAWVNTEALRRAGVDRDTPEPEGGQILRDAKGEPTGVLIDNAMDLVSAKLPALTVEQHQRRLSAALRKVASVGLTGVHDAGMDLRTFEQLQQWDAMGVLPVRVYAMADGQGKDAQTFLERGTFRGRMLELRSVKFLMDGALGSRGAALHAPYSDDPGNEGLLLMSPETLEQKARAFMERGFQVNVHAIGDRANTLVLDALERAAIATHSTARRHRLEHAQVLRPEDIQRLPKLGIVASMQPTHATSDAAWAEQRLGPARARGAYAWRSVLDAGAILAFGSDFPIEAPDPLAGLYAARTRQDANGQPEGGWYPEQRITAEEALRAFTVGAAYASFGERQRGSLAAGMDADFVVLSVDPVEAPPRALLDARVLQTVVAGRVIHDESLRGGEGRGQVPSSSD